VPFFGCLRGVMLRAQGIVKGGMLYARVNYWLTFRPVNP
jgi:hypothetical protein